MEAPLVTLPSPPKPTLPKDDALLIASDLDTPKLPTLTPGSEDYVSDWDITADFSIEEPITVVSITPVDVADTRTVIATNGMPVPGNVERAALQLLETMADDVAKPAPLLPPQPPSPLPPKRISKPEGEVDFPPPVSTSPPHKKMKIISLPPAPTDRSALLLMTYWWCHFLCPVLLMIWWKPYCGVYILSWRCLWWSLGSTIKLMEFTMNWVLYLFTWILTLWELLWTLYLTSSTSDHKPCLCSLVCVCVGAHFFERGGNVVF